jgi:hypothetical protein
MPGLEERREDFERAAEALRARCLERPRETERFQALVLADSADFLRASGQLAMNGIEELARATASYRRAAEASARAMQFLTVVIAFATLLNAFIAFMEWRHPRPVIVNPPTVNIAGPTINLPPQAPSAPAQPLKKSRP